MADRFWDTLHVFIEKCTVTPYNKKRGRRRMRIGKIRHRGLRRFYEDDDPGGLPAASVPRIRNMLAALVFADSIENLKAMPGWRLHQLIGDRRGKWSLTVTGNWRIVFRIEADEVADLDFEDYH
jgi:toxin HigB-1